MADPHGRAFFGKLKGCTEGQYTCSHGVTPSAAVLTVPLGASGLDKDHGDLVFTDGKTTITLRDAKLDTVNIDSGPDGRFLRLPFLDRRWKWAFPVISGRYNQRDKEGYVRGKRATHRELVQFCFDALGEKDPLIDVPDAPKTPTGDAALSVEWDHESAAQALAAIADQLGCRVGLDVVTNRAFVMPVGSGAELPKGNTVVSSGGIDFSESPDALQMVGAEILFQVLFDLEPVGIDEDEYVKAIDDLSYKPSSGWERVHAKGGWTAVQGTASVTEKRARELAAQCIWRWYRIKGVDVKTLPKKDQKALGTSDPRPVFVVPGWPPKYVVGRENVKLTPYLWNLQRQASPPNSTVLGGVEKLVRLPAKIYGAHWRDFRVEGRITEYANLTATDQVLTPFTIDAERGIVQFSDPVFKLLSSYSSAAGSGIYEKPTLKIHCSITIRDDKTGGPVRSTYTLPLTKKRGTAPGVVRRPEIQLSKIIELSAIDLRILREDSNQKEVDAESKYYLEREATRFQDRTAEQRTYPNFHPISLDGAIQQVTWQFGESGCFTTASRNFEFVPYVPDYYKERRRQRSINVDAQIQFADPERKPGRGESTTKP